MHTKRYTLNNYCTTFLWVLWFSVLAMSASAQKSKKVGLYIEQGEAEWEIQNYTEAVIWFAKAIEIDSACGEAYFKRAKSFLLNQQVVEAKKDLLKADSLHYEHIEKKFYWGIILSEENKHEEALSNFENAIKEGYESDILYSYMAESYKELKNKKQALFYYQKAIALSPKTSHLYWLRANFYYQHQDFDLALQDLDKVTQLSKRHWEAYKLKADIYFRTNKDALAIENRLKYIQYNPSKNKIVANDYSLLAYSYAQTKQLKNALIYIQKAIDLDKENPEYFFEQANYYILLKSYPKALESSQKAIEFDGFDLSYFRQRAFLLRQLKKYQEALQDYVFLAQQDEQDAENHYFVGEMKYHLKTPSKEFQKDIQTAFQLGYPKEKMLPELQKYAERKLTMPRFLKRKITKT